MKIGDGFVRRLEASATEPDVVDVSIMYDEKSTEKVGIVALVNRQQRIS